MTSNMGSSIIQEKFDALKPGMEEQVKENAKYEVFELLKRSVRPEFLNRIDETVLFTPLTQKDVEAIVDIQLEQLKTRLLENDIRLIIKEDAIKWIAEAGFDPHFGARPVKRIIQKTVLNELSKQILADKIDTSQNVVIDLFDSKIVFRKPISEEEEVVVL